MAETSMNESFPTGFPLSLTRYQNPMQVVEDTLFMRACQLGILEIEVFDSDFSAQQGLRANTLMPVLVDYVTHVFGMKLQWEFQSAMQDQVMMEILEQNDQSQSIAELMKTVSERVNRPALYNKAHQGTLLNARTELREASGIPLSVTLMMMDMALETAHEMSMAYQQELIDDPRDEVLDLTPVIRLLQNIDAQPRVYVPETIENDLGTPQPASEALAESILANYTQDQEQRE